MPERVLVTGGAGYLGSILCEHLLARGFEVTVLDNLMYGEQSIFHLAAQSYVPTSWLTPGETLSGNVLGQVNLFEAIRELDLPARVHLSCHAHRSPPGASACPERAA